MGNVFSELLGKRIREIRKEKKMTLTELGKKAHLAPSTISYYERGLRRIEVINFFSICKALNADPKLIQDYMDDYISKD